MNRIEQATGSTGTYGHPVDHTMDEHHSSTHRRGVIFRPINPDNTNGNLIGENIEIIEVRAANGVITRARPHIQVPLYRKIYRLVFGLIFLIVGFPLVVLQTVWRRLRFIYRNMNPRDNIGPILFKILVHIVTFTILPIVMGRIVSFVIGQDFILYPDGMPIYQNTTTMFASNSSMIGFNNSIATNSSLAYATLSSSRRRAGYHTNLFEKFTMVLVNELGWSADKLTTRLLSSFIFIVYSMIAIIIILFSLLFHCLCIYFIIWKKWVGMKPIVKQIFLGNKR